MNRKYVYAGAAAAAFALPLALMSLPTVAQEAAPLVRQVPMADRMQEMLRNGDMRGMMEMLQAQARGADPRAQGRSPVPPRVAPPQGRPGPAPQLRERAQLAPQRPAVNPLEQYDTNKDGATTQAEINDMRANRLKQFDKNADTKLTIEEYAALWLDAYRRHMVDQFQKHDDDGDGLITVDEFNEDFANLVRRGDMNGDGKVDATDVRRPAPPAAVTPVNPTVAPMPTPANPTARGI
ncbi:MAG: hypothetical protein EXQ93_04525 [Alphaproteobacteria bacterium]|nr:hypothetical protein [Alphaproteobacteria bacterium]